MRDRTPVLEERRTRRVLMFAKRFPPCNCWPTASERAAGLARGLSNIGWTPVVITRGLPTGGCQCGARDGDGAERLEGLEVIRVPVEDWLAGSTPRVLKRLALSLRAAPDDWVSRAKTAALRYVQHVNVDLVWTTAGPIVSARLGRSLRRKLHIPWVAELRDSVWRSSVQVVRGRGAKAWILRRRASWLARPLRGADAVVHVAPREAQADADLIPRPSYVIPSGFDEIGWAAIHASAGPRDDAVTFTVLLAGHVYAERPGYSTFFEGARMYAQSPRGKARPLRVAYLGPSFEAFRAHAQEHEMADTLVDGGVVSLARSRRAMVDADALLLIPSAAEYSSPGGKFFEYLASCRPILAVPGTDEFVVDALGQTGHGMCAPNADTVCAALEQVASGAARVPSWPSTALQSFTWSSRSRLLAEVFDSITTHSSNGRIGGTLIARDSARAGSHS
jgi:hypothetical protein